MNTSPFEHNYPRHVQQIPVYQQRPQIINQYPPQTYTQNPQIMHHSQNHPPEQSHTIPMTIPQPNYQPNIPQNYPMIQSVQHPNIHNYPQGQQIPPYDQNQMQMNPRQVENDPQYEYGEEQYEYQEGQNSQEDSQDIHNQQIILFWEHKFYTIHERFQWVHDKVQWMRTEFYNLNNQLKAVDSQSEWNDAKQHHEDYIQQLQEFSQELTGVINENQNLLQQREIQGEENGVWKQRYYELFQSFKVMEQELIESKENRNSSDNREEEEDQRYQEFVQNYRQLQRQYTNAVNQLQEYKRKQPNSDQVKEYRGKLDYALRQAEKYKDIVDRLHEENQQMNGAIEELREKNTVLQGTRVGGGNNQELQYQLNSYAEALQERQAELQKMNAQMQQMHLSYQALLQKNEVNQQLEVEVENKRKQIEMLKSNVLELRADHKSVTTVTEEYQRLLKNKYHQLEEKNEEISKLRREVNESSQFLRGQSVKEIVKRDYQQRIEKVEAEYQERIFDLKKKIKIKEEEIQMNTLTVIKLESCEKKIKLLTQEIQALTQNLDEKDRENSELKRFSYEAEKLRGIESQYNFLLEERENLNGALLQKNYDIDNLQSQLNQFELRIKEINEKNVNNQSKVLINQIQQLNEIIRSKDTEITKLRSSLALKETYSEELEIEVEKSKSQNASLEKYYENEKEIAMEKIASLERKNQQLQKKMRELQHQFGANMIKNLEDQIRSLRVQNQSKQENIIRMQGEELELRSRISHYQRIRNSHNSDIDELSSRIRELQNSKSQIIKKMEVSLREVKSKERQMKDYIDSEITLKQQLKNSQSKVEESQILVKEKENIIKQLEDQLTTTNSRLKFITEEHDSLRMRRRDETDVFMKESDDLKRKLFQYEHNNGSLKQIQSRHQESLSKVENKLMKQLQQENQILRNELANALDGLTAVDKGTSLQKSQKSRTKGSEGVNYIQKRLFDFNSKLDDMIMQNRQLNQNSSFRNHQRGGSMNNAENWNGTFKFAENLNKNQNQQIQSLKNQLNELRKYCARLEVQVGEQMQPMIVMEKEKMYNDQCQFYKEKIVQLQSRIDNLIEVNSNLKSRLDGLLKGEHEPSSITYYKEQLTNAQETIDSLNKKLRKILEENRTLKLNNNEATTKLCRDYEDKIFDCENKIFTLERKVANMELEKIKTDNQKANLTRSLKISESEVQTMKGTIQKKLNKTLLTNEELSNEVRKGQSQMNEMLQKIRLLQSQNNRLTQAIHSSMGQQNILLSSPYRSPSRA